MEQFKQKLHWLFRPENNLKDNEDGQILVLTALSGLALVMMVSTIFNVGMVTGEKMKVQNAADAAAYSQAVWEARTLNFLAYTNRAIISHMVTIAFATAMLSQQRFWETVRATTVSIPFVNALTNAIASFWEMTNSILQPPLIQSTARRWIDLCQLLQKAVLTQYVYAPNRIPLKIAESIDPAIKMNGDASKSMVPLTTGIPMHRLGKLVGFGYPYELPKASAMEFKNLKHVYEESMDGFSRGNSFPRGITVYLPPTFLVRFKLRGRAVVDEKTIRQQERFLIEVWEGFWGWEDEVNIPLNQEEVYDGLPLGNFRMFNAQKSFVQGGKTSLPVYAYAKKSRDEINQIPLLGAGTQKDITALAGAEVFFWDPDQKQRSPNLRKITASFPVSREPNLFNPFWHARLAPLEASIPALPFSLAKLPVTH